MGTNTLTDRGNTTITADWFNSIHQALKGSHVPRNASGVPTTGGGDLGSNDYRWGTAYLGGLNIGGRSIDFSDVTANAHRVVSGAAKASGYPEFLTPAGTGNGLSATLDGTSVDFEAVINDTSVSVASDLVFSSLTAAPSSNNTCAVNDASLAGAASTKVIGEHGDTFITIGTIGTGISALDGTIAAFKIGTEVFLALVDTSNNRLYPIFRGWADTDRATISHAATITLLKVNTLLLKSDGVTVVSSTYYPESVSALPAAGTAGKVYHERANGKYAYDDGSTVSNGYMVIGFAICDAADCVWVQPTHFDLSWEEDIAVSLAVKSTTAITVKRGSVASVAGNDVTFFNAADFTQASHMDTGEVIAADTVFYVYLKSTGAVVFSSVMPRPYNHLLKGMYHPKEYYRCVGSVVTNTASEWLMKREDKASTETLSEALVPVGAIIPIVSGYFADASNGTFTDVIGNTAANLNARLSSRYRVCDGSALVDPESPIFASGTRHLPNLTDSRFLMGSTAGGSIGGATNITPTGTNGGSMSIAHTHTFNHNHQVLYGLSGSPNRLLGLVVDDDTITSWSGTGANFASAAENDADEFTAGSGNTLGLTAGGSFTYYSGGVRSPPGGSAGATAATSAMSANSTVNGSTFTWTGTQFDNRPQYLSAIYVMRVK